MKIELVVIRPMRSGEVEFLVELHIGGVNRCVGSVDGEDAFLSFTPAELVEFARRTGATVRANP